MKKTFEEKIEDFFVSPKIELVPAPSKHLLHLYADYVELVSVFSNQNYVTADAIIDRLKDEGYFIQQDSSSDQAEANDEREGFVDRIFQIIYERSILFKDDYPFLIISANRLVLRESRDITIRQKVYITLLLSSSLNLFKEFQTEITTEFELLCMYALKAFLPSHAIVKSFGKNSDYKGTAVEKIQKLAKDLNVRVDDEAFDEISKKGMQERGLDLIGWIPFEDKIPNLLSILCQCACGKEWYKKLNETSRYNNYFSFHRLKPVHSMFIPYGLTNHNGNRFYQNDEISDKLLFDRKRIMNFITDLNFFNTLESKKLVERCVQYEERIV